MSSVCTGTWTIHVPYGTCTYCTVPDMYLYIHEDVTPSFRQHRLKQKPSASRIRFHDGGGDWTDIVPVQSTPDEVPVT